MSTTPVQAVVGFDDVQSAPYHTPAVTPVDQPLRRWVSWRPRRSLRRIATSSNDTGGYQRVIMVEPELNGPTIDNLPLQLDRSGVARPRLACADSPAGES